ncbi:hypothetical protein [Nocardioides sp.]|uniref:hypothetical protein n=1 Tax=Nocardioides sp. TaxID=35761 RepID=UPI0025E36944|nr:hypothetical protein [Nocardioides sp.]
MAEQPPDAVRAVVRAATGWLAGVLLAAVVSLPWAVEQAVEGASFEDRVGTLPVEISLAHDGYTTLDTGLLGKVYWRRTGPGGFGAVLRSTGPPIAGGTLASYASPAFVQANTRFLDDPEQLASTYGAELRGQVVEGTLVRAAVGGVVGGTVLALTWSAMATRTRRRRWVVAGAVVALGAGSSLGVGWALFRSWEGHVAPGTTYPLPSRPALAFSSPQARELAVQVQPFIEKNARRIRERGDAYRAEARATLAAQISARGEELQPREGEVIVLAEADPQGSFVGVDVRRDLYAALAEVLPEGSVVLRTIAGDVTSNGTVAEAEFVRDEATVTPDVPVVAAKGDHDTDTTVEQLLDAHLTVPDTELVDAGGLRVASARDPAFKALFGGLVVNDTGLTEDDIGERLRAVVDEEVAAGTAPRLSADASDLGSTDDPAAVTAPPSVTVVLHQPRAVAGYLGADLDLVRDRPASLTTPVDDGIPDLPPGIVTYGHLHDAAGPWVVWNTDGDVVTWTVITQLGTAGGVEENPTFNRFSTPFSAPLKTLSVQLQYVNAETGLQTGLVPITFTPGGEASIGGRVDVGLPGGVPTPAR